MFELNLFSIESVKKTPPCVLEKLKDIDALDGDEVVLKCEVWSL